MKNIGHVSWQCKIKRLLWLIVYTLLFRPFGTRLFLKWRIFLLKIFGAKVTWKSSVYSTTKIWAPWNLEMEDHAGIGPHTIIYNQDIIHIGKYSKVSQHCYLCTAGHDISELNNAKTGLIIAPIIIKDKAWIGTKAFINMGVTIGEGAVIGATASIYKDVEAWTVVGGNPAQFIKKRILK